MNRKTRSRSARQSNSSENDDFRNNSSMKRSVLFNNTRIGYGHNISEDWWTHIPDYSRHAKHFGEAQDVIAENTHVDFSAPFPEWWQYIEHRKKPVLSSTPWQKHSSSVNDEVLDDISSSSNLSMKKQIHNRFSKILSEDGNDLEAVAKASDASRSKKQGRISLNNAEENLLSKSPHLNLQQSKLNRNSHSVARFSSKSSDMTNGTTEDTLTGSNYGSLQVQKLKKPQENRFQHLIEECGEDTSLKKINNKENILAPSICLARDISDDISEASTVLRDNEYTKNNRKNSFKDLIVKDKEDSFHEIFNEAVDMETAISTEVPQLKSTHMTKKTSKGSISMHSKQDFTSPSEKVGQNEQHTKPVAKHVEKVSSNDLNAACSVPTVQSKNVEHSNPFQSTSGRQRDEETLYTSTSSMLKRKITHHRSAFSDHSNKKKNSITNALEENASLTSTPTQKSEFPRQNRFHEILKEEDDLSAITTEKSHSKSDHLNAKASECHTPEHLKQELASLKKKGNTYETKKNEKNIHKNRFQNLSESESDEGTTRRHSLLKTNRNGKPLNTVIPENFTQNVLTNSVNVDVEIGTERLTEGHQEGSGTKIGNKKKLSKRRFIDKSGNKVKEPASNVSSFSSRIVSPDRMSLSHHSMEQLSPMKTKDINHLEENIDAIKVQSVLSQNDSKKDSSVDFGVTNSISNPLNQNAKKSHPNRFQDVYEEESGEIFSSSHSLLKKKTKHFISALSEHFALAARNEKETSTSNELEDSFSEVSVSTSNVKNQNQSKHGRFNNILEETADSKTVTSREVPLSKSDHVSSDAADHNTSKLSEWDTSPVDIHAHKTKHSRKHNAENEEKGSSMILNARGSVVTTPSKILRKHNRSRDISGRVSDEEMPRRPRSLLEKESVHHRLVVTEHPTDEVSMVAANADVEQVPSNFRRVHLDVFSEEDDSEEKNSSENNVNDSLVHSNSKIETMNKFNTTGRIDESKKKVEEWLLANVASSSTRIPHNSDRTSLDHFIEVQSSPLRTVVTKWPKENIDTSINHIGRSLADPLTHEILTVAANEPKQNTRDVAESEKGSSVIVNKRSSVVTTSSEISKNHHNRSQDTSGGVSEEEISRSSALSLSNRKSKHHRSAVAEHHISEVSTVAADEPKRNRRDVAESEKGSSVILNKRSSVVTTSSGISKNHHNRSQDTSGGVSEEKISRRSALSLSNRKSKHHRSAIAEHHTSEVSTVAADEPKRNRRDVAESEKGSSVILNKRSSVVTTSSGISKNHHIRSQDTSGRVSEEEISRSSALSLSNRKSKHHRSAVAEHHISEVSTVAADEPKRNRRDIAESEKGSSVILNKRSSVVTTSSGISKNHHNRSQDTSGGVSEEEISRRSALSLSNRKSKHHRSAIAEHHTSEVSTVAADEPKRNRRDVAESEKGSSVILNKRSSVVTTSSGISKNHHNRSQDTSGGVSEEEISRSSALSLSNKKSKHHRSAIAEHHTSEVSTVAGDEPKRNTRDVAESEKGSSVILNKRSSVVTTSSGVSKNHHNRSQDTSGRVSEEEISRSSALSLSNRKSKHHRSAIAEHHTSEVSTVAADEPKRNRRDVAESEKGSSVIVNKRSSVVTTSSGISKNHHNRSQDTSGGVSEEEISRSSALSLSNRKSKHHRSAVAEHHISEVSTVAADEPKRNRRDVAESEKGSSVILNKRSSVVTAPSGISKNHHNRSQDTSGGVSEEEISRSSALSLSNRKSKHHRSAVAEHHTSEVLTVAADEPEQKGRSISESEKKGSSMILNKRSSVATTPSGISKKQHNRSQDVSGGVSDDEISSTALPLSNRKSGLRSSSLLEHPSLQPQMKDSLQTFHDSVDKYEKVTSKKKVIETKHTQYLQKEYDNKISANAISASSDRLERERLNSTKHGRLVLKTKHFDLEDEFFNGESAFNGGSERLDLSTTTQKVKASAFLEKDAVNRKRKSSLSSNTKNKEEQEEKVDEPDDPSDVEEMEPEIEKKKKIGENEKKQAGDGYNDDRAISSFHSIQNNLPSHIDNAKIHHTSLQRDSSNLRMHTNAVRRIDSYSSNLYVSPVIGKAKRNLKHYFLKSSKVTHSKASSDVGEGDKNTQNNISKSRAGTKVEKERTGQLNKEIHNSSRQITGVVREPARSISVTQLEKKKNIKSGEPRNDNTNNQLNGMKYRAALSKPHDWVTDRLYKTVIKTISVDTNTESELSPRRKAEKFVLQLCCHVNKVIHHKRKGLNPYITDVMKHLYLAGLIKNNFDFSIFCMEYLPETFIQKALRDPLRNKTFDKIFTKKLLEDLKFK